MHSFHICIPYAPFKSIIPSSPSTILFHKFLSTDSFLPPSVHFDLWITSVNSAFYIYTFWSFQVRHSFRSSAYSFPPSPFLFRNSHGGQSVVYTIQYWQYLSSEWEKYSKIIQHWDSVSWRLPTDLLGLQWCTSPPPPPMQKQFPKGPYGVRACIICHSETNVPTFPRAIEDDWGCRLCNFSSFRFYLLFAYQIMKNCL